MTNKTGLAVHLLSTDSDTRPDSVGQAHTPGQLEAIVGDVGIMDSHICYVSIDDGLREIARVRLDREGALATAHLFAASPDLLAVAKDMLPRNLCLTNQNISDGTVVPLEATMGELRRIAAAIAKAKGGQP